MSNLYAPFRYDYVGSFLRPAELKKARADYEAGAITADQLKAVEDQCITELVAKQKAAGYHVITDGEFRRATWHLDFMWGFDGVGHKKTNTGLPFHGEAAMIDDTFVTGRIGLLLWSSIFVTLMANKIGGLQFGIYRNCQISSRVFHTAVAALPLTKANRSDFE